MLLSKTNKVVDVGLDSIHAALHRRDGIRSAVQPNALAPFSAKLAKSQSRSTAAVHTRKIAAKHENLIRCQPPKSYRE